jgi:hypothetical protein
LPCGSIALPVVALNGAASMALQKSQDEMVERFRSFHVGHMSRPREDSQFCLRHLPRQTSRDGLKIGQIDSPSNTKVGMEMLGSRSATCGAGAVPGSG